MNYRAVQAIYLFEMARTGRTLLQSIVSPVISTSLYFVVFGAAIGARITQIDGISYGAFIVPGLIMLMLLELANRPYVRPGLDPRRCRARRGLGLYGRRTAAIALAVLGSALIIRGRLERVS